MKTWPQLWNCLSPPSHQVTQNMAVHHAVFATWWCSWTVTVAIWLINVVTVTSQPLDNRAVNFYVRGLFSPKSSCGPRSSTTWHGSPSCCVCNMTLLLMDSDCRHMASQCGHSDFSVTTQQSGKLLSARFVFAEVQLRTPFFHHMTLRQ